MKNFLAGLLHPGRPQRLLLRAVGEEWTVDYRPGRRPGVLLRQAAPGRLLIEGRVGSAALCREALRRWLKAKARQVLVPQLHQLARRHGFSFARVQIRCQKTRWGSCSSKGTISLNLKLLFLPPALVEHVLIHELCHTVHLNHSRAFWALVGRCDPRLDEHRAALKQAVSYVPAWL